MSYLLRSSALRQATKACSRSIVVGGRAIAKTPSNPSIQKAFPPISVRFFSAKEDLLDILTREHAEEIENDSTAVPPELAELKSSLEKDWKIVDDGATTRMFRSVGSSKVQVFFHCQDTVEVTDEDYEEPVEEEAAAPVRFAVMATKAGKTLVLTCISEDATAKIQGAGITMDDVETIQQKSGIDSNQYQGPEFTELAEDLQDSFHTYLEEELGINENVASFVAMQADFREQINYVQFLEDAKSALSWEEVDKFASRLEYSIILHWTK